MNMHIIDWVVVFAMFAGLNIICYVCKKYVKGVAGFLVAGRSVGRYLGMGSGSMMGLGAISILAIWQMGYKSGFVGNWLWSFQYPFAIVLALTGFAVFRFRETKAMTIPQLMEMRYSKKMRIFCGLLTYIAGVLNMGIFPVVGANFVVYFCGFPTHFELAGMTLPTVLPVMLILVGTSVVICFLGGQVTLIVTDFIQSVFVNVMMICFVIVIYKTFTWDHFTQAYLSVDNSEVLLNPFKQDGASEFNPRFFLIQIFWMFYLIIAWSPDTMQVSSAKDAKEAKLMRGLLQFRYLTGSSLGLFLLPLSAFVVMHHPDFSEWAAKATQALSGITNPHVASQIKVPATVAQFIPAGLLGAFVSVIVFAFISTHDSYMLAWGSVLIQDVIIPMRKKPLTPKQHLNCLRLSVAVVAVSIIIFSLTFEMTDNIFMFMALSGSVYTAGAGIVILGALYWKRATTLGAWASMITGTSFCVAGFVYRYKINPDFKLDGFDIAFYSTLISIVVYFVVSLAGRKPAFDLNKLLNRKAENEVVRKAKWWQFTRDLSRNDKVLFWVMFGFTSVYFLIFAAAAIYNFCVDTKVDFWLSFWKYYLYFMFYSGLVFVVWITIGGFSDLRKMFASLKKENIDTSDDGSVENMIADQPVMQEEIIKD